MTSINDERLFANKSVTDDVKRKVLAEKRAHETVKSLLEENVSEAFFIEALCFLTPEHYDDVVEERAISHLCGYAACRNKLKKSSTPSLFPGSTAEGLSAASWFAPEMVASRIVDFSINLKITIKTIPSQQYKISGNKVYDITQRKNFCSNTCYKSSEDVRKQILTTPLWLRDPHKMVCIELTSSGCGLKGEEVDLMRFAVDDEDQEAKDSEDELKTDHEEKENTSNIVDSLIEEMPHLFQANSFERKEKAPNTLSPKASSRHKTSGSATTKNSNQQMLDHLLRILQEWITEESLKLLGYLTADDEPKIIPETTDLQDQVRKNQKQKLLEEKMNQVVLGKSAAVRKEVDELNGSEAVQVYVQRVEQFYKGQIGCKDRVRFKDDCIEKKGVQDSGKVPTAEPIFPHVDSKNQTVIRRKILHQKLSKFFEDMMPHLPTAVTSHDLKQLISSFRLSSSNVVLSTNQYPVMAVMLMQIMSKSNSDVRSCLQQSKPLLDHMLSTYRIDFTTLKERTNILLNGSEDR